MPHCPPAQRRHPGRGSERRSALLRAAQDGGSWWADRAPPPPSPTPKDLGPASSTSGRVQMTRLLGSQGSLRICLGPRQALNSALPQTWSSLRSWTEGLNRVLLVRAVAGRWSPSIPRALILLAGQAGGWDGAAERAGWRWKSRGKSPECPQALLSSRASARTRASLCPSLPGPSLPSFLPPSLQEAGRLERSGHLMWPSKAGSSWMDTQS